MITVVTGAAGFLGRAVVRRMAADGYPGRVRLVDQAQTLAPSPAPSPAFETLTLDLTNSTALAGAVADADRVLHLASLPGGASEAQPLRSRAVNLDASLDLITRLSGRPKPPRLVFASSIAVFGAPEPVEIDDATPPCPAMTYGAHKLMTEIALADAVRRGDVDGLALRLPGIVARPRSAAGLKSAFLSDLFWAIRDGGGIDLPVGPEATTWILSADCCAANLIHALSATVPQDSPRALTTPAWRVTMVELADAIALATGRGADQVRHRPDPSIEAQFGRKPALRTDAAERLGLRRDASLAALCHDALASMEDDGAGGGLMAAAAEVR